jgi:hypothetical protein
VLTQRLERFLKRFQDPRRVDKGSQLLLALKYRELARTKELLPGFRDVGFRSYSQNDEDGIILYIFSLIGASHAMRWRSALERASSATPPISF